MRTAASCAPRWMLSSSRITSSFETASPPPRRERTGRRRLLLIEEAARPAPEALDGRDAVAVSVLIALPVALYAPAAGQWWTGDDTQLFKHALSHTLGGVLTVPCQW